MKLKKVEVTYQYVIVVEDDADSEDILDVARENALDACINIGSYELGICVSAYKPGRVDTWGDEYIPYGGDDNTTIGEYLK